MSILNLFKTQINDCCYFKRNYFEPTKEKTGSEEPPQQEYSSKTKLTSSFFKNTVSEIILSVNPVIIVFRKVIPILSHVWKSVFFSNSLENKLAEKLDDVDRAHVLAGFCRKIQKNFSNEELHLFEEWLLKYCQILSSAASKEKRLMEELDSPAFQNPKFKTQIIDFLNGIDREIPIQKEAKRIAILYTSLGGGGRKAPAIAIKDKLVSEKYTVEMIDIDEIEKEYEPKIFGRGHEDIWTEFYQRKSMPTLANFMRKLHHWFYLPKWRKTTQVK